jgi:hypothetical protein
MSDLTIASTGVAEVFADKNEVFDMIAAEALTAGQVVYQTSAGKAGIADANASGKQQARGIVLYDCAAGKPAAILRKGFISGYALSGVAYDGPVYLSDTAGKLADGAGTMTVNCGRVMPMTDPDLTKILFVDFDLLRTWA